MPKIAIISPKVLIDKVSKLVKKQWNNTEKSAKDTPTLSPKTKKKTDEPLPEWATGYEDDRFEQGDETDFEEDAETRFQISLQDLKLMHTSLVHFQKYLKAKGQTQRAKEVGSLHEKVDGFIQSRES